jgi:hypothetical protein
MIPTLPNIFVLCMHKAASTFVADVLLPSIARRSSHYDLFNLGSNLILFTERRQAAGEVCTDRDPNQRLADYFLAEPIPKSNTLFGRIYPGHLAAIEEAIGMPLPNESNKLAVVRRDPRDALVSLYYSVAISHDPGQTEGDASSFRAFRDSLAQRDLREGLKYLLSNEEISVTTREFMCCTRLLENPQVGDLPYELLLNKPLAWLKQFIGFAGLERYVDEDWYEGMITHLQPPETEDPARHKRRMKPGNWVDVFDGELKNMFDQRVGSLMEQFGYVW